MVFGIFELMIFTWNFRVDARMDYDLWWYCDEYKFGGHRIICFGFSWVSQKDLIKSEPQYSCMWPYLETGSLWCYQITRSYLIKVDFVQYWCLYWTIPRHDRSWDWGVVAASERTPDCWKTTDTRERHRINPPRFQRVHVPSVTLILDFSF